MTLYYFKSEFEPPGLIYLRCFHSSAWIVLLWDVTCLHAEGGGTGGGISEIKEAT